jgi:FkbM family methyltransferase
MGFSIRNLAKKALGVRTLNSDDDQRRLIPDAKIIFDVGANVGQTAKTYRRLFPQAEIWSFEPFPASYESLRRSVADRRFHPERLALSDRADSAPLNIGAVSITNSLLRRQSDTGKSIEIQTDTIDHFCSRNGISNIDILKVDVEGAEDRVFSGARNFWDLQAQLSDLGFRLFGLYSLITAGNGALSFGNALYVQQPVRHSVNSEDHLNNFAASFAK